jgi:hypothetical protein
MLWARTSAHPGEVDISSGAKRDFASLLDDLFVASDEAKEAGARPSIPFDYLSVVDELHSGRIRVSGDALAAEYRETGADMAAEFSALLEQARLALAAEHTAPEEKLPPIDPESIAAELGLDRLVTDVELNRLRRSFAFDNHPDRVAPHLRPRAIIRMQVANMLIDDARRKAPPAGRR